MLTTSKPHPAKHQNVQTPITDRLITTICRRLGEGLPVRRTLPGWGRLHIDRQLPFLTVYRRRPGEEQARVEKLVTGEASYLICTDGRRQLMGVRRLVREIAATLGEVFGSFLIVEIWIQPDDRQDNLSPLKPQFRLFHEGKHSSSDTVETLLKRLTNIRINRETALTEEIATLKLNPPGLSPLIVASDRRELSCHLLGIEVKPIYHNPDTTQTFPLIRRELQRGFNKALRHGFFEFTRRETSHRPANYLALGRHRIVKAVWEIDEQITAIGNSFDFLLQVTPLNIQQSWSTFRRGHFEHRPRFKYRPLPIDPVLIKRKLFQIPLERVEDATLEQLFQEQQLYLDRQLTMLIDRDTPRFRHGSLQLYGELDDELRDLSLELLRRLPPRSRDESTVDAIDAETFATIARQEISSFSKIFPQIKSQVVVRDDVAGLLVSQGNLFIGSDVRIPRTRIEALIQHEVGTHILTYNNGLVQPFRLLRVGLAGYEELQEGLAVFAEYLVGGLTRPRLRLLAARVVAARLMVEGATFVDVFRELTNRFRFTHQAAFTITLRIFRSSGLTKDAIYLRGLLKLLEYLKGGGALEQLLVGKIAAHHLPIIRELQWRKILEPVLLLPRYLADPLLEEKIKRVRNGATLLDLVERTK